MLQMGIRSSGSNTGLLQARTSVNREYSLSQLYVYLCESRRLVVTNLCISVRIWGKTVEVFE
jgi:hypothetical protein